ncbi:MAG: hypothetical protein A2275_12850 [Bacteroidetes bacterium RIFOXYA12_FULL_35_11]|nr:MAG: hypothetical protein A2X01_05700 [Bacteroidetes bacterium GWF2_35_48]OFY72600.1 MAG: hypothetical protein A2275_12850 [Bacteroidetes bacterium RIFOXYA12_FULL_35_11]HBX52547.1 dinitrogenase iron-molybdenum cofactor biosynthesis protein [Bacteroidales bacterium]
MIAITSTGNTLLAGIDKYFARCSYFLLFNETDGSHIFIENNCRTAKENAGLLAVDMLLKKGVRKVISGEFGMKVKSVLDEKKIQMILISDINKTINDIITLLKGK